MDDALPKLPQSVAEIAEVIGRENALALIGKLPQAGSRRWRVCLYIPKTIGPDHSLVRLLGWHDAVAMVGAFSGMILQPSNCARIYRRYRKCQVLRMAAEGLSAVEIADIVDLSVYRTREIIAEGHNATKLLEKGH